MINKKNLKYVCCPRCHEEFKEAGTFLICRGCQETYRVVNGIPLLTDERSRDEHYRRQISYFEKETKIKQAYFLEEWQKSFLKRFNTLIPAAKDKVIADIGTGTGYMAIELAKRGNVVLACDLNLQGMIRLKKISQEFNLTKNLFLFVASAEKLPIRNSLVDIFISNAILEHLPREKAAIKELSRICQEKAYGFVTVPLKLKYIWPFLWPINFIHDRKIGHLRRYDGKDLKRKFSRHGFKIKEVLYTGHLVKVLGVLAQMFIKTHRLDKYLEKIDRKKEDKKYGASNILAIMKRG
jgi:ubiquinone/menaquinone biosynthesis C-methylase UbiE